MVHESIFCPTHGVSAPRRSRNLPRESATMSDTGPQLRVGHLKLAPLMNALLEIALPLAAAGWSLLYLLFGGGFVGAIILFIVLKMLRK